MILEEGKGASKKGEIYNGLNDLQCGILVGVSKFTLNIILPCVDTCRHI